MASDNEASCVSDPNFAVICSFLEFFGKSCGISYPDIAKLQSMLEDNHDVPQPLIDLHIKLLRKTRKSVSAEKWEKALVKFCHTYSNQDGWEVERFGYKKVRTAVKVRLLKVLLESQFDLNQRFKNEINKLSANELRLEPLGRDKTGQSYWFQLDDGCNMRVYREDLDEESWELVAKDRKGLMNLISTLADGEAAPVPINEDSNSLEISEKPITDTGQVTSPSLDSPENDSTSPALQPPPENLQESEESSEASELTRDSSNLSQEDSQDSDVPPPPKKPPLSPNPIQKPSIPSPKAPEVKTILKSIETPVITTSPPKPHHPQEQKPLLNDRLEPLHPRKLHQELQKPPKVPCTLSRLQLEKPGASKLEKIAENLARTSGISMTNGDEPQDFRARGMDLSTSPRGWESSNDRPVDFSGMDLSKSSFRNDFQAREIDLSTRKSKESYDRPILRATMMDLSKRPVFTGYESYHNPGRPKEEHRLPNYSILPDPSKLSSMRMKRGHDEEQRASDPQEMVKRLRGDLIPRKGRREEVGAAIEEPLMMVQGEGSGSECEAGRPPQDDEVGEAIEETFFFQGEGNGVDCDTGNPGDETSSDNKESNESKDNCGDVKKHEEVGIKSLVNDCDEGNCQGSSASSKVKFKPTLGVQVFTKSPGSTSKRLSRWDVRETEEKRECDSSIVEDNISVFSGNDLNSTSIREGDISSTTNQNSISSSRISEPTTGEASVADDDDAPRFFFGPNCVSYTSEAATKCPGDDVTGIVSRSEVRGCDPEGEESGGTSASPESSEIKELIVSSENPEPSISDNPESSLVIKSSDDLVTNSSGSRVESTDPESSEVVSTVYDDDKSTGTAEEPQTTSTTTGDFITPEDKDDEVDSTEAESMLPESSGPIINSNDEEELSPGGAATVAPAPIVDGNALKSPERINIALAETSEAKNTDADDNRSVSLDQDSNEAMVIDDRESDSNESTKEISDEGKCGNPEKIEGSGFKEGVAADRFGDVSDDLLPSQEDISPTKEEERELDEALESIETDSKVKGEKINSTIDEIDPKTETSGEAQPEIEESEVVDEFCSMSKEPEETAAENEEIPDIEKNSSRTERDDVEAKKTEEISPEIKDNPLVLEEYSPERENIEPQVHKLEDISKIEQNPEIVEEISQELSEKPQDESPQNPEPEISEEKPSEAVSSTSEEDPVEVPEEIPLETVSKPPERSPESPESPTTPQDLAISAPEDVPLESPLAAPDTQLRTKPSLLSQASLVANYGSDDSNLIGSDDVFDVTPPESEEPETTPEVTQNVLEEFPSVSEVPPVLPDIQSVPQDPEVLPEVSQFPCEIQEAVPDVPDVESPPRVPEEPPEELKSIQSSSETPPEVEFTPEVPPEVPGPVETTPELVEPVPEVQTHPEEPQQPEIIANPTPVDLSANLARETPENQTERPVFSPEEIPLDEKPFDSPDMFDSSKPETPIEIDNQDIEKIAATLNQDDDDDDEEPPELQIEEKMSSSSPEDMETPQEVTEPTNEPPPSLPEEEPAVNPPENPPVLQEMEPEVSSKLQDPEEKSPEASTPPELEAEKSESSPAPELSPEIPEKSEIPRESEVKIQEKIDESPVLQEQIFESRVITMNDHQRKELESDEETSPIRQLSKRPRTETELSTKNETLQKPLELLQVEHNSLQELKPERNILETLKTSPKPIFEELKPQIILNVSQDKSDVKKEASKRLHLEQDPEDLPPIKSSKEDFKDVNDVERPSDIKTEIPNNLEQKPEVLEECKPQEINNPLKMSDDSEDSMGIDNECIYEPQLNNVEPLEELSKSEVESSKVGVIKVKEVSELQYDNWKLDSTEPQVLQTPQPLQKPSRKRRNSAQESNPEDGLPEETDDAGGKRIKLRGKRSPDINLRKSVEASRGDLSSDDECQPLSEVLKEVNRKAEDADVKPKGKKGRKRKGFRGKARPPKKDPSETPGESLDTPKKEETTPIQKKRKKRKMVLGLEIGIDIVEADPQQNPGEAPVRQSRRIAQIKIKEEADRRRIEEETLENMKSKKDKESDKNKKKRKKDKDSDEEVRIREVDRFLKDKDKDKDKSKKKRKKRKKKEAMMRFNEAKPWQSSSGSSSDTEDHEEEEEEEEETESEDSLLFKSDHEFSPESDLEKDAESEPLRRARTAQKSEEGPEEADEYACQKCGKADHPEWILLCDTCDKGWHCSCLRPALMLIPEGDWFCPPCQHTLLINKLRESLKTYDQSVKKHENEVLRKKRLAYVGISLDNVLPTNEVIRRAMMKELARSDSEVSREDSGSDVRSDSGSSSSSSSASGTSTSESSSEESEPVYQLRERRCANTSYKFNEYDDMINAAIQDEVEAVQGAGNQGRGKDISTIVNAEKEEAPDTFQKPEEPEEEKSERDSDKEFEKDDDDDDEEEKKKIVLRKSLGKKKHRKLNSLDISSEDDPESDEDFKGTSSDYEEDYEDQMISSDDSYTDTRRKGKRDTRPVRRSTRAARRQRYDEDFINDDSDDSDKPKRKKSRSIWDEESESEESDNSWRSRKKRGKTSSLPRTRAIPKPKGKKKKKRRRIVQMDSDNGSDNEESPKEEGEMEEPVVAAPVAVAERPPELEVPVEKEEIPVEAEVAGAPEETPPILQEQKEIPLEDDSERTTPGVPEDEPQPLERNLPQEQPPELVLEAPELEKKREKKKKEKTIRRKIIYGGLPEDRPQEEDEPLGRRTRGRKINYQVDTIMSDSEEELKKALRKTEDSEDEFLMNDGEEHKDDNDKDSDSADEYSPQKGTGGKHKSPKNRRGKKSPGRKVDNGEPKQRKKPGPKPGSKNKPRLSKSPGGGIPLEGSLGEVEGSLASLAPEELGDLNDEQLAQMMMEDEEYGRRQLELAAIEIAKNKKKEEREAKKLEKARQKALEILAAEQQRDPNAPEGADGEAPKKKKRGRRSKAEILAEQIRRGADPALAVLPVPSVVGGVVGGVGVVGVGVPLGGTGGSIPGGSAPPPVPPPAVSPMNLPQMIPEMERHQEHLLPHLITGPDGQLLNPDGSPMKPKRRGRGKGKKTLAMEAARAEAAAKAAGIDTDLRPDDLPNPLPTPGSSTSGSAPSTPPLIPPTPVTQSQIYPQLPSQQSSVITRMLQAQPIASSAPQSFTAAAAAMGQKYFGVANPMMGPRGGYDLPSRGRIPSPYNSRPGGPGLPVHFAVRSGAPPMRMRVPGPSQLYHTPHHPMDPSPSGGGPISITSRDRSSPLASGPAMIPPAAGSPLAKGGPTPPPPPYVRGGPLRFGDPQIARHPIPPFTTASGNHSIQQPSPPPNRPGNFSPYHPQPPPNYHYGAYPPPPMSSDDAAYQGSPYPSEHFSGQSENPPAPPVVPPPPAAGQSSQASHPTSHSTSHPPGEGPAHGPHGPHGKYDEEGSGEFGGLVSYFSSQREDDLDS